ncbi:DNA-processing protein DprA [Kamptonema formosum]|uniref:DNA-processing protein DprA n=1 Tax=Kamptonema formosum TaxID=331992 RepID=UPI00035FDA56|nr:DNA-processing protein DprA [Oscillatoria sp. PCC 10802]
MLNHVLMPDTQAILLLCASFGQSRQTEPEPLRLREYNDLAGWLKENQMRPADLLTSAGKQRLQEMTGVKLNPQRLAALLERGGMLALAVEKWTNKGLWVLGRSDASYPKRLKQKLKHSAPAILYGAGNPELLSGGGLAVVGSRDVEGEEISYTQKVAQSCGEQGIQVISGCARGVDEAAILGVMDAGGKAVGVLADSLTKVSVSGKYRSAIREGRLVLISPYDPDAGFNTGNAMGRNKYIYGLADAALVVSSSFGKGGTWAGALEALEHIKEVPVFVRNSATVPEGNRQLIGKGAKPFPENFGNDLMQHLRHTATAEPPAHDAEVPAINVSETGGAESPREETAPRQGSQSSPKDIYEAVLPFILEKLQQPKDAKSLAECLDVRLAQMQDWLKKAVAEGRVVKTKNGYAVSGGEVQLSLLDIAE